MIPCRNSTDTLRTTYCLNPNGWTILECPHGTRVSFPRRCKQCTGCIEHRKRRVTARILRGLHEDQQAIMLTLTTPPDTEWSTVMTGWQEIIRVVRRAYPTAQYVVAKELGKKSGMHHLHALITNCGRQDLDALRRAWYRKTAGRMLHVDLITSRGAAAYVAKYVTKAPPDVRKGFTFSKLWPRLETAENRWTVIEFNQMYPPEDALGVMTGGGLILSHAPGCSCRIEEAQLEGDTLLWLKYLVVRLSRHSPAVWENSRSVTVSMVKS